MKSKPLKYKSTTPQRLRRRKEGRNRSVLFDIEKGNLIGILLMKGRTGEGSNPFNHLATNF